MKSSVRFSESPLKIINSLERPLDTPAGLPNGHSIDPTYSVGTTKNRLNHAGMTPHNKQIEAQKNVQLWKNSIFIPMDNKEVISNSTSNANELSLLLGVRDVSTSEACSNNGYSPKESMNESLVDSVNSFTPVITCSDQDDSAAHDVANSSTGSVLNLFPGTDSGSEKEEVKKGNLTFLPEDDKENVINFKRSNSANSLRSRKSSRSVSSSKSRKSFIANESKLSIQSSEIRRSFPAGLQIFQDSPSVDSPFVTMNNTFTQSLNTNETPMTNRIDSLELSKNDPTPAQFLHQQIALKSPQTNPSHLFTSSFSGANNEKKTEISTISTQPFQHSKPTTVESPSNSIASFSSFTLQNGVALGRGPVGPSTHFSKCKSQSGKPPVAPKQIVKIIEEPSQPLVSKREVMSSPKIQEVKTKLTLSPLVPLNEDPKVARKVLRSVAMPESIHTVFQSDLNQTTAVNQVISAEEFSTEEVLATSESGGELFELPSIYEDIANDKEDLKTTSIPSTCDVSIQCNSLCPTPKVLTARRPSNKIIPSTKSSPSVGKPDSPPIYTKGSLGSNSTPMFTSYHLTSHDSDSDADDDEFGLQDFLQHLKASGPIIGVPSTRSRPAYPSPSMLTNSYYPVSVDSRTRSGLLFPSPSTNPATAGSSELIGTGRSFSRTFNSYSTGGSKLGRAVRVDPKSTVNSLRQSEEDSVKSSKRHGKKHHDGVKFNHHQQTFESNRYSYSTASEQFLDSSEFDQRGLNATFATDMALKAFPLSDPACADQQSFLSEEWVNGTVGSTAGGSVGMSVAETTFTLDRGQLLNHEEGAPARMLVDAFRRDPQALPDMKEIIIEAAPGRNTTVKLSFSNRRSKPLRLVSHTILMRFEGVEEGYSDELSKSQKNVTVDVNTHNISALSCMSATKAKDVELREGAFIVSPQQMTIQPGHEETLFVTFSPKAFATGVYSGVLKIKSNKKNFVILLRGEAKNVDENNFKHMKGDIVDLEYQTENNFENKDENKFDASFDNHSNLKHDIETRQKDLQEKIRQMSLAKDTGLNSSKSSVPNTQQTTGNGLSLNVKGVLVHKNNHSNKYDGELSISYYGSRVEAVTHLTCSSSFLRLTRNKLIFRNDKQTECIRVMLDTNDENVQEICHKMLSQDPSIATTSTLGFITIKCEDLKEEFNIEVNISRSTAFLLNRVLSPASNTSKSVKSYSGTKSLNSTMNTLKGLKTEKIAHYMTDNNNHSHRHHQMVDEETMEERQNVVSQRMVEEDEPLFGKKVGVFFRRQNSYFGSVSVGSLTRTKIELCNATDHEVTVFLGDPSLPFVLLHNEVHLRPRSYVRLPVRFLPVTNGNFESSLIAQTDDGAYYTTISLTGSASE